MPTLKQEFKDLAAELIGDEFADFALPLSFTITTGGTFDPVTEVEAGGTTTVYSYQAIPMPIDIQEWQGADVQVTDIPAVYTRVDAFKPSVGDTCTFDGEAMQLTGVKLDPAGATVEIVMRAL